jgi:signal peptidase I
MTQVARQSSGGLFSILRTVVIAGAIAFTFRSFAFEPFNIPSGSMLPTLLVGDFLFVSKYSYGYSKYSFPGSLDLFSGRVGGSPPKRGDVAVFRWPRDTSIDYIKRVIGLPGDRIQMRSGRLFINGGLVEREHVGSFEDADERGVVTRLHMYIETLPNGVRHHILEHSDQDPLDNTPEFVVPEGNFFAMGDNRDNSQDSRVMNSVGFVPMENLVGRAEIMFFSIDDRKGLVFGVPNGIRWSRIFNSISP